jgi:hypothetical protein
MQAFLSDAEGRIPTGELLPGKRVLSSPFPSLLRAFPHTFHGLFDSEEPFFFLAFSRPLVDSFCRGSSQVPNWHYVPANSRHNSFWLLREFSKRQNP